jgi:hypothetical protein
MLVSVKHYQAGPTFLKSHWIDSFNFLEDMMARLLTCSFLPLAAELFVTSHGTLIRSGNSGTSLPAGIIIYDDNGSASA